MSELELKFRIPDAALASLRQALRSQGARRTRLQARYFDTEDGLLARHLVALRLRLEGRRWVQTLKAAGAGAVHRLEHEVRVPGSPSAVPPLNLRLHDGSEAGDALQAALQSRPDAELLEQHGTDITRLHCLVQTSGGTVVEVALDTGQAMAGSLSVAITELELEHKGGPVGGLFEWADALVQHGGLWLCSITKAERGQRLAGQTQPSATPKPAPMPTPRPARKAQGPRLAASADGATLLRTVLQATLTPVLAAASEVAEGDTAADTIHRLRVALRRLRTVLHELQPLSAAIVPAWDAALADSFALLGQTRDQQAVAAAVQPLLQAAGAPRLHWQADVPVAPAVAVREGRFQATLLAILALAHAGPERFAALSSQQVMALLSARLHKLHGQVAREGRHFEALPIVQQHRVRKRVKRLRYLIDLTGGLWPERGDKRSVKRFVQHLSAAQAALGAHNDVAVAAAAFRRDAAAHPEAWFAAGWLQAHLAVTARRARKALVKVAEGHQFWA